MTTITITGNCVDCIFLRVSLDNVQKIVASGTDSKGIDTIKRPGTYHISWTAQSMGSNSSIELYLELTPKCEVTWGPEGPWLQGRGEVYRLPDSKLKFKGANQKIFGKAEFTF